MTEGSAEAGGAGEIDLATFGQRLRHYRLARGLTLAELGQRVGRAPSALSALENGRREPKLSLLQALARGLGVSTEQLLEREPPNRRAQLEIAIANAAQDPSLAEVDLPALKISKRVGTDVLEHIVALYGELRRRDAMRVATPEEARRANTQLRRIMRERANYFPEIEQAAAKTLTPVGHRDGALSQAMLRGILAQHGFSLHYAADLPWSARSIADLRHQRIYVRREPMGMHTAPTIVLQTLGHVVLGHAPPRSYFEFLQQRVEANYFAAAVLVPEQAAVAFLREAKQRRDIAVEDLRDRFAVSYEMACHRFTNLITEHLGIVCHFIRCDERGIIYKAYENDGLAFPVDPLGAIEGQRMCRQWAGRRVFGAGDRYSMYYQYTDAPDGTHFCIAHVDPGRERDFAITLGVPYLESQWFRGQESAARARSRCPDPACCRRPPAELTRRWEGMSWPSARAPSHVLATLPPGSFPGVDDTEVYAFLERHALDS
ncbi:helix-turn-helix domain-containing protein [Natronosporangium hydrolyticum]|uniref:Helix-turn-helix domain-containing protein n=1 Tax=Natronosporangium hydrolyticum TaxID=2811111 RepID=A0A895YIH0_9ACTN|nr:helix-turn-helix domain-containing protein [Natronosporangium hydrolyticum]